MTTTRSATRNPMKRFHLPDRPDFTPRAAMSQ